MNWDAIGAIGETVGAIAVVVSILYLAYQIRSNTRATRASASFEATHSWSKINQEISSSWSPEQLLTIQKSFDLKTSWEDIGESDRAKLVFVMRSLFQSLEGQYYLYRYGLLDKGQWEPRSSWAKGTLQLPFYQKFWEVEMDQRVYSEEFVEVISGITPIKVRPHAVGGSVAEYMPPNE